MGEMDPKSRTRDEWIVLRCQLGEPGAFAELVREMERPLLYYAAKLAGGESPALDVLQEVWMTALRSIHRLAEPRALRPWLYRLVRGVAVDRSRRERARERAERARAEGLPASRDEPPSFAADEAAFIHRALDVLEPKHREALVLHFLDDLSIAEIGAVIGEPAGTVKSRIFYAKRALREELRRRGYEHAG